MRVFKKLFISIITLSIILSSCGDDDDDNNGHPIVGTWESTTFSQTDCDSLIPDIVDFSCGSCFINEFNADGTFSSTINVPGVLNESLDGTYMISSSTLTTCDANGENCEDSTFNLSGDNLVIMGIEGGCTLSVNFMRG